MGLAESALKPNLHERQRLNVLLNRDTNTAPLATDGQVRDRQMGQGQQTHTVSRTIREVKQQRNLIRGASLLTSLNRHTHTLCITCAQVM